MGTLHRLTILAQSAVAEYVDRALLDGQVGRAGRGLDPERHHQRPRGATMGHCDGVGLHGIVPVPHPQLHRGITLAARRGHRPFIGLAPGEHLGVGRLHFF